MKTITTIVATSLMFCSSAFADETVGNKLLVSDGHSSKTQAYDTGFEMVNELKSLPQGELDNKLLSIDGSEASIYSLEVTVEEYAAKRGVIEYRAVVDVQYNYWSDEGSDYRNEM